VLWTGNALQQCHPTNGSHTRGRHRIKPRRSGNGARVRRENKTDLAFCPLREVDSDADLTWAVSWLEDLCTLNGLAITPKRRNAITQAVIQLQLSPSRTLTELSANVQDLDVREALQFYTLSGPLGQLGCANITQRQELCDLELPGEYPVRSRMSGKTS
jgi:type IV secretory pathway VirB4 component